MFGVAVTFQNNSLGWLPLMDSLAGANTVRDGAVACGGRGWLRAAWDSGSRPGGVGRVVGEVLFAAEANRAFDF